MKAKDLRELTEEELGQKLEFLRKELFLLRQKMGTGRFEKFAQIKQIKRDIARVLTIQNEMKFRSEQVVSSAQVKIAN
ncbi:MAG: 50S ribosomal protein L29 [Candidatus Omnitrophica bacterium]|nr:50S ribosomal protein L29 [Candidatus Omnitrophota bacterium]